MSRQRPVFNDDMFRLEREQQDRQAGPFDPKCCVAGCGRDGCHGVGVSLRKGVIGRWFCSTHWHERGVRETRSVA